MSKQSLFLVSRSEQENMLLSRRLEPLRAVFKDLETVSLHPQGLTSSMHDDVGLVIFNFNEWTSAETAWIYELERTRYEGKALILARSTNRALKSLGEKSNVVFLEKPFETKELLGISGKMLRAGKVGQQHFKRYSTDQLAEVEFHSRGERFDSRVCNLSRGGAYLELAGEASFRVGDKLSVTFQLSQLSRVYTLPVKVVWMQPSSDGAGVGVEFVGRGDVKRTEAGF